MSVQCGCGRAPISESMAGSLCGCGRALNPLGEPISQSWYWKEKERIDRFYEDIDARANGSINVDEWLDSLDPNESLEDAIRRLGEQDTL